MKPKRKPGGQPGNLNAVKHGLYSSVLDRVGQERFALALTLSPTDLHREIALLRERAERLLSADATDLDLLRQTLGTLARLAATHYHISGTDADRLTEAMSNVLDSIERTLKGA